MTAYAELAVTTSFSFLRGASQPAEMVAMAAELGLAAIGIADRNSLAGVVRAYDEARRRETMAQDQRRRCEEEQKRRDELMRLNPGEIPAMPACDEPDVATTKLLVGARLVTVDGFEVLTYPVDRAAYGRLCKLLTQGQLAAKKGGCELDFEQVLATSDGQMLIVLPPDEPDDIFEARLDELAKAAPRRTFLAGVHRHRGDEPRRLGSLAELGRRLGAPMVAVNDAHYHDPGRQALADIVTCIREKCTVHEAGLRLSVNAERYLKAPDEMARLFADFPEAIARTVEIVEACAFSLAELKNEYPDEPVPPGKTPQQHLADLAREGLRWRYPKSKVPLGIPERVVKQVEDELALIEKLDYARYFLTVHDIVAFARGLEKPILCQGRGSAANSAVCYCLGITEVDPHNSRLLFARFLSENRREPPDIDVDFEHERREEVIQYIYERYGRERAAICATVIHYRSRRAIREVGKALGLTPDVTSALARTVWGISGEGIADEHIRQAGLDPANPAIRQAIGLAGALVGFPRHLSQHVGGFILTRARLDETVPIGNGAMKDRTFIEWDKDDIDTLGLMKVDVLALGMLSCLRRGLDLMRKHHFEDHSLASVLAGAETEQGRQVFDMLSAADSVGVFQVESRAQMSMLPRLKPKVFYDLVIEVAIVRPGPIQGDMVHPYLRRRDALHERGEEPDYPKPGPPHDQNELREVLKRTLGVPLFQEQAMQIAITAAEFSPAEADGLRRAMATFRHMGTVHNYRGPFIAGMTRRGYDRSFAESCFKQIEGFGDYGFPESHAASFALLVYVSAWIKCHHPEVFCAAILNSQPMGFYQPAQLVRDARQHGVEVREVDVNESQWDCTLEQPSDPASPRRAVRLGFRMVSGLREEELGRLVAARGNGYASVERLGAIADLTHFAIERLAEADAFRSMGLDRRQALWAARRLGAIGIELAGRIDKTTDKGAPELPLFAPHLGDELFQEPEVTLPAMRLAEHVVEDYVATGLSLKAHPISFFRERLTRLGAMTNAAHRDQALAQDMRVTVAGLVLMRQVPGTAKGVVFATLEDETGIANIIVWPKVFARHRITVMTSRFLAVRGRLQRAGRVVHVIAESFVDLGGELARLAGDGPIVADGAMARPSDPPLLKSRDFH